MVQKLCKICNRTFNTINKCLQICSKCKDERTLIHNILNNTNKISNDISNKPYKLIFIDPDTDSNNQIVINEVSSFSSTFSFFNEISSFLTPLELLNFAQTSSENFNFVFKSDLSLYIQKNILNNINLSLPLENKCFTFNQAIAFDLGIYCHSCRNYFTCPKSCINFGTITKTHCLDYYKLHPDELSNFDIKQKYHGIYKKYINLIPHNDVKLYISKKHTGFINFIFFKEHLERKQRIRKEQLRLKREAKEKQFDLWVDIYIASLPNYSILSQEERKQQLDFALNQYDLIRTPESSICNNFIIGNIYDMHIDEIVVYVKLKQLLSQYNNTEIFFSFEEKIQHEIVILKSKSKNITWLEALNQVYKRYIKQINKYIDNIS